MRGVSRQVTGCLCKLERNRPPSLRLRPARRGKNKIVLKTQDAPDRRSGLQGVGRRAGGEQTFRSSPWADKVSQGGCSPGTQANFRRFWRAGPGPPAQQNCDLGQRTSPHIFQFEKYVQSRPCGCRSFQPLFQKLKGRPAAHHRWTNGIIVYAATPTRNKTSSRTRGAMLEDDPTRFDQSEALPAENTYSGVISRYGIMRRGMMRSLYGPWKQDWGAAAGGSTVRQSGTAPRAGGKRSAVLAAAVQAGLAAASGSPGGGRR